MSKQYEALAKTIVDLVGGKANVTNVYHCQTRLRFTLVDEGKADVAALEATDGIAKVIENAGVFQIVIGPQVEEVCDEVEKLVDLRPGAPAEAPEEKQSLVNRAIDFVSSVFMPIIPALSGAGMVKAVMALLVVLNVIDNKSQTYYMLNIMSDAVFYFLPVLLAFTEAKKLKCNPILAAAVGAMLLHPNWLALVTAGDPVSFFGVIPFTLAKYGSSVIPIILVVLVQSYVEKGLNKVIPKAVNLVFVPMCTFIIMGTLAFSILGPIGNIVGGWLATVFTFLAENAAWAPAMLIGGLCPVLVMFGLHNGIAPLGVVQMTNLGYDSIWGPGNIVSNMCQATAGLVVFLRTKDHKLKEIAGSGAITAYMGITEPILYGVNLPKKYPLVAAMIGGAVGGLYAGLTHTHRFATGSGGLPAILLYIGDDTMQYVINIAIAMLIGAAVTAVLTFFLGLKFEGKDTAEKDEPDAGLPGPDAPVTRTLSSEAFVAPVAGTVAPVAESADEAFSSGALGAGVVVEPSDGHLVSPCDGTVTALFPTGHAIGITSDDGAEVLIHIGIDTVQMEGKGFTAKVAQGERVTRGQALIDFDVDAIRGAGYDPQTMMVVSNTASYQDVKVLADGSVSTAAPVLELTA